MLKKVSLHHEAHQLDEFWSQRVVGQGNGNLFKVAKGTGSTTWHGHADQDETFLVLEGSVTVQLRDGDVVLEPGDLLVIPRGVEHCPKVEGEARFLLVGPEITSNAAGGKPAWSHSGGAVSEEDLQDQVPHRRGLEG